MAVLTLAGKKINWAKPPKANTRVMWSSRTSGGKKVTGSLRSIAWLDHVNALARKKYNKSVVVIQSAYNTGVLASAGTHDLDACFDVFIPGVGWSEQERFFRANGAGAFWRKPPAFGHHIHLFALPPQEGRDRSDDYKSAGFKVGKFVDGGWSTAGRSFTSSQIADYYAHRNALSGHAHDPSWHPADISKTIFNLSAYIAKQRGTKPPAPAPAPPRPAVGLRVDGVDISRRQTGLIHYGGLKAAGVKWMIHKATEGDSIRDPLYVSRRIEAKAAKFRFGSYHFGRPDVGDAGKEALFYLKWAKPGKNEPMVLDIESMEGLSMRALRVWVKRFSDTVLRETGRRPWIYTKSDWDLGPAIEDHHIMWRARYNNDNRRPARRWDIHQFSDAELGRPNSVAGHRFDLNNMRPGLTLAALGFGDPAPKPPLPKPKPKPQPPKPKALVWRGKVRPVDGPILTVPPGQHHWAPKVGDRLSAWRNAHANDALDGNLLPGAGTIWFLHSSTAEGNGYTSVVDVKTRKVRPMTKDERTRSLNDWGFSGVKRWRDKHGQAPMTINEGLAWLVEHRVYGALEVKGSSWAGSPEWFERLHEACQRAGHPAAVKRLAETPFPRETVIQAHRAGVKIAAIYGKKVKGRPARLALTKKITKDWEPEVRFDATW